MKPYKRCSGCKIKFENTLVNFYGKADVYTSSKCRGCKSLANAERYRIAKDKLHIDDIRKAYREWCEYGVS